MKIKVIVMLCAFSLAHSAAAEVNFLTVDQFIDHFKQTVEKAGFAQWPDCEMEPTDDYEKALRERFERNFRTPRFENGQLPILREQPVQQQGDPVVGLQGLISELGKREVKRVIIERDRMGFAYADVLAPVERELRLVEHPFGAKALVLNSSFFRWSNFRGPEPFTHFRQILEESGSLRSLTLERPIDPNHPVELTFNVPRYCDKGFRGEKTFSAILKPSFLVEQSARVAAMMLKILRPFAP